MKSLTIFVIATNLCLVNSEISKIDDVDLEFSNVTESSERKNTVLGIARTLDIFNVENLYQNWNVIKLNLSVDCATDIEGYLHGLENQEKWALKMEDASGRYSTGWFWGNQYWTGSQTLCENIAPGSINNVFVPQTSQLPDHGSIANSTHDSRTSNKGGLSHSDGYAHEESQDTPPPFPVSFYMIKIGINTTTFQSKERIIHVGLCFPKKCTKSDMKSVMEWTAEANTRVKIEVQNVGSHHHRYDMLQDNTFRILCVATIGITMMLIAGTAYDLYLQKKKKQAKDKTVVNYTSYDVDPVHVKLDIGAAAAIKSKGKSTVYVVNNNNVPISPENVAETSSIESQDENPDCTSIMEQILLSFSVRINMKTICDKSVGSDTIPIIHGLRSISMAWVILGHTCIVVFKYSDNMDFRKLVEKEFLFQTITNGAFSVDTFFFISGLLVSFIYFRTNAKGKLDPLTRGTKGFTAGFLHFVGLVFYRFARLTAPYLFVLGLVEVSMKWFYYNSIFEPPTMDHINCPNYWWRNVLYINTLFPVEEMCMLWSWYLSDDTQFYIFGAIILILANSHFKTAGALLALFMVSSWLTTGYIAFQNHHMPNLDDPLALFDKIYDKPWTRLGPYLVGMAVGWILFKTDCKIKMSKLVVLVGWLTSISVLLSLVYGLYEANLTPISGAAYSSLSHTAWALGLAWIVIACMTGYGGYVNKLLSATVLYPFSRVTYCAYLVHPIVLRGMTMSMDSPLHLGKETMVIIFLGQMVASYVLSFIVSVAVEAPVVTMLKILSRFKVKK